MSACREIPGQKADVLEPEDVLTPEYSEESLALKFAERHANDLRYVAQWGQWLQWNGTHWKRDDTLLAYDLTRQVCREAAAECDNPRVAIALASAKTVGATLALARADRRIAATVDQWDADPWLLNTPAGVVDLQAGSLKPHRPVDYFTKITGCAPDRACPTPLWSALLRRVAGDDDALVGFLQRMAGYGITGITREHALFFLYGTGANGKTTLLRAITDCAGDYHRTAPIETFTATHRDQHPTDLAGLRGARLVTAFETEEGRRWAESRIKVLTGGDPISARFMRQDFFEYIPQFKLVIVGNHKPGLRSVDEAIRRRLNLVPFTVTIPEDERDTSLGDRLRAEYPGILAWMIDGCMDWQERGLAPPRAVLAATAAYLDAEDALARWIDECTERDPNAWESSAALHGNWKHWAERVGEHPGSMKRFSQSLEAHGCVPERINRARGFRGLRLTNSEPSHGVQ